MGNCNNYQRRNGIEPLRFEPEAFAPPTIADIRQIFDTDGEQLYFSGISEGYGTCADIHGMDVLVLSEGRRQDYDELIGKVAAKGAYTVLVRHLNATERERDSLARVGFARLCTELLEPQYAEGDPRAVFRRTGKTGLYTRVP